MGEVSFTWNEFVDVFCNVFSWKKNNPALKTIFQVFDTNKDGTIDFQELMIGLSILTRGSTTERIELCFSAFDLDKSGDISKQELLFMIQTIYSTVYGNRAPGEQEIRNLVDRVFLSLDTDKSGTLSLEEFRNVTIYEPQLIECFFLSLGVENTSVERPKKISLTSSYIELDEAPIFEGRRRKGNCNLV